MAGERILVVDDFEEVCAIVGQLLTNRGYRVDVAHTGADALTKARGAKPDLMVLDLMLPDLDGCDVCSCMRRDPLLRDTPVLMLTARTASDDVVRGFGVGADDYVTKPFDNAVFLSRVAALLRRSRPAAAVPARPASAVPGAPPALRGYVMLQKLAQGAMGAVYKAVQASLDRVVAVKILDEALAADASFVARFLREAKLAATLSHPNIVAAIDAGEEGGRYYFAMEYVEGETVEAVIAREGRLAPPEAVRTARDVALGLDHARTRGLIHRDVKPSNIMIARDGTTKLTDLGLARSVVAGYDTDASLACKMVGTPHYMSPEQIVAPQDVDTRADVYALGASLFHMLTGHPPFNSPTVIGVTQQHLHEPRPYASRIFPDVSGDLCAIVRRALCIDRTKRFQTPGEMAEALTGLSGPAGPA